MSQPDHPSSAAEARRAFLRHTVATLAYRAGKVLRETPEGYADLRVGPDSRTPLEILSHMGDLMTWASSITEGESRWEPQPAPDWESARERFFREIAALDAALERADLEQSRPLEVMFQGPIADALTHTGQLAMLRRLAGVRVRGESYARAEIVMGRVGPEQRASTAEFDVDASWPKPGDP